MAMMVGSRGISTTALVGSATVEAPIKVSLVRLVGLVSPVPRNAGGGERKTRYFRSSAVHWARHSSLPRARQGAWLGGASVREAFREAEAMTARDCTDLDVVSSRLLQGHGSARPFCVRSEFRHSKRSWYYRR